MPDKRKVRVTSDSTCDLGDELIARYDVGICPIAVILGDEIRHDTVDIDSQGVLDFVEKTGKLPKTAATSQEEYAEYFRKELQESEELIHFCISSKASSCYEHATAAAKEVGNVHVVDSKALSGGQGLLILKACDLLAEGKSAKEVAEIAQNMTDKIQLSFVVDTLEYLHKGGRCSSIALVSAKLLKIHPSIYNKDGELVVQKKYIGSHSRCVAQYIGDLAAEFRNYDDTRAFITHPPSDPELVEMAKEKVKELFKFKEVFDTQAGSTVTSHCGRNTLGVLFINK
ncbi:MAG: DegV family protein [Clostridia bacterium]|nr:DegV family protein [Clostridia bacterium]